MFVCCNKALSGKRTPQLKCHHLATLGTLDFAFNLKPHWFNNKHWRNPDFRACKAPVEYEEEALVAFCFCFVTTASLLQTTVVSGRSETWKAGYIFSCVVACFSFRFRSEFGAAAVSSKCLSKPFFLWLPRFWSPAKVFSSVQLTNCCCTHPWHIKGVLAWTETWLHLRCHDIMRCHFHSGKQATAV